MKNKIEDLRDHLFAQLEDLRDPEKQVDLNRARLVVDTANTIVASAKAETEFLRVVGGGAGSGFIPEEPRGPRPLELASDNVRRLGSK